MWIDKLYERSCLFCETAADSLYIYCPYVKASVLGGLLAASKARNVVVVTTWTIDDILAGYSDLESYPILRERGAYLYLHSRLHMKAIVVDGSKAVIMTANLTRKGLGLVDGANIECAQVVPELSYEERAWFLKTVHESVLVQDDYFAAIQTHINSQAVSAKEPRVQFDDAQFRARSFYLISSLPMTCSPSNLIQMIVRLQEVGKGNIDAIDLECALHDVALYELAINDSPEAILNKLRMRFFIHPFIVAFAEFIEPGRYFGEVKEWLQCSCADVPVPRRRELTENVRVLFDWCVELSEGRYLVSRPNYSEYLVRRK